MNKIDMPDFVSKAKELFPRFTPTDAELDEWFDELRRWPIEDCKHALSQVYRESKYANLRLGELVAHLRRRKAQTATIGPSTQPGYHDQLRRAHAKANPHRHGDFTNMSNLAIEVEHVEWEISRAIEVYCDPDRPESVARSRYVWHLRKRLAGLRGEAFDEPAPEVSHATTTRASV